VRERKRKEKDKGRRRELEKISLKCKIYTLVMYYVLLNIKVLKILF
jgi:hypothetical protein